MHVVIWKATARILTDPRSLKEKRSVVSRALERMRHQGGVSVAEVGLHDTWNLTCLGLCSVGTDPRKLEAVLAKARVALESQHPLEVIDEEVFLESY